MEKLRALMNQQPQGSIDFTTEVEHVLASCWAKLDGGADGGMEGYKLKNRMESVEWNPPVLEFNLERHGATVNGSVFAGVQHWSVNVTTGEASLIGEKRRQVGTQDSPLKVGPLVDEIISAIDARANDARLKWAGDQKVRILIDSVIPATVAQTTSGRRKRFWNALEEKLKPHGWTRVSARSSFLQKQL
jgi:hypothetical protein